MRGFPNSDGSHMYAVVRHGASSTGSGRGKLRIEQIPAESGRRSCRPVLVVADGYALKLGAPFLAAPRSRPVAQARRGDKVRIFKLNRRKHTARAGASPELHRIEILAIA